MIIELNNQNPNKRDILKIVKILKNGGVIIFPTDTGYAFGCDLHNKKAIGKIVKLKQKDNKEKYMSFICSDLKNISEYANITNVAYKVLKRCLPGPYTFILEATNSITKLVSTDKRTVGIRIPDNNIDMAIVNELNSPITSSSINHGDDNILSDPIDIDLKFGKLVDIVIDGGIIYPEYSTVIDFSSDEVELVREGKGSIDWLDVN